MISVFGSYNVDVYLRQSSLPGAGEIATVKGHEISLGGKGGNQAVALARAGHRPLCFGCVGKDALGEYALSGLRADRVVTSGIARSSLPTGVGLIFLGRNRDHRIVYAMGANAAAASTQVSSRALKESRLLLAQGDVPMKENEALIERASRTRCEVMLTLGPFQPISKAALLKVRYLIVNATEAGQLLAYCREQRRSGAWRLPPVPGPRSSPATICGWMHQAFQCAAVVTLGQHGAVGCDHQGANHAQKAIPIDPADTVGAGDTFSGYFAAGIAERKPFPAALKMGVVAASLACRAVGAQRSSPKRSEVDRVLRTIP